MESAFQDFISLSQEIGSKVNPIIDWIAQKIATFIQVDVINIHLGILVLLAWWVSGVVDRENFSLKRIIATVIIFIAFKYIGM